MSHFIETRIIPGKHGNVAVIYLNRPEALNALNHAMMCELKTHLTTWKDDPSIKLVFIHGKGRAFCAGGDIRELYNNGINNTTPSIEYFRNEYSLNQLIFHYPKPYISYLDGITMGGGAGISLHGSHQIATPNFVFAMPETNIGFFPDVGLRYHLARLPRHIGLYLALSGNSLDLASAAALSIVTHTSKADQAEKIITALASTDSIDSCLQKFQINHPKEIKLKKRLLDCYQHQSLDKIAQALQALNTTESLTLLDDLTSKSLFSLQTTLQSYQDATDQDFDTIIKEDLSIATRCLNQADFYEGIRAMLVDKDKLPVWKKFGFS
jgi:enoyl-CoA hydratase